MSGIFLGVDTSNYTTSLALCSGGKIIKSIRKLLPVKEGERGLRQSDAVFLHTKALPELAKELFADTLYSTSSLCAVGVSSSPRDAEGSYMPCFLAGVSFASAVSYSHQIPLYSFSHQAGHIKAGIYSCGNPDVENSKFVSFHISGGTTEAILVTPSESSYKCEIIGGTNDTSAGQIIDRAGVYSGIGFPCGKELDKLANHSNKNLGKSVSIKGAYFSLSGLQNKYESYIQSGESISNAARFIFESIACCIEKCTYNIREQYGNLPVLYAGGVMSNSIIRKKLSSINNVFFASPELSCDNACGTALLCEKKYISDTLPEDI